MSAHSRSNRSLSSDNAAELSHFVSDFGDVVVAATVFAFVVFVIGDFDADAENERFAVRVLFGLGSGDC